VLVVEVPVTPHGRGAGLQGGPLPLNVRIVPLEENGVEVLVGDQAELDDLALGFDPVLDIVGFQVHVRQGGQETELLVVLENFFFTSSPVPSGLYYKNILMIVSDDRK
jgi:hypothetical protein